MSQNMERYAVVSLAYLSFPFLDDILAAFSYLFLQLAVIRGLIITSRFCLRGQASSSALQQTE